MRAMFVLKPFDTQVIEQEVKVVEEREVAVRVNDGDEVYCLVRGIARALVDGREIEIRNPEFVEVVRVVRK